jgi:hypothetical protein
MSRALARSPRAAAIATSCRRISLFASRSRIVSAVCCAPAMLPHAVLDCGDLHERGALLPLRFDAIGCLARARQIFGGNLREHDVVQHPVAESRLANLLDRCQSQVDRAIGWQSRR